MRPPVNGERLRSTGDVGETEAVCRLVADYHAVARHYPADGGHAVTRSQATTYPASWVDLDATSHPLGDIAHGQRQRAGAPQRRVCGRRKADSTGATPPGQAAPWSVRESARKLECQGGQRCSAAVKAKSEVQSEGSSPMRPCRPAERRTRTGAVRPCRLGGRRRTRTGWMRPCRLARRRRTRIRGVRPCRLGGRRRTRTGWMRPCRLCGRRRTRIGDVRPCRLSRRRRTRTGWMRPCRLRRRRRTRIRRHSKKGRCRLADHSVRRWPRRPAGCLRSCNDTSSGPRRLRRNRLCLLWYHNDS